MIEDVVDRGRRVTTSRDADGPDATVHDLFARIRADVDERRPDVGGRAAPTTADPQRRWRRPESRPVEAVSAEPTSDPDATAALDRRDELLAAPEKGLARLLKRAVSDEQNEVLDALRRTPKRQRPDLDVPAAGGRDLERSPSPFDPTSTPPSPRALSSGPRPPGDRAEALLDVGDDPGVGEALTSRVGDLLSLRRAHLQRTIDDADADGARPHRARRSDPGGLPGLALDRRGRARGRPRDGRASPRGSAQAAGPTARWCWLPDNGGLPCSDAEDNCLAGAVRGGRQVPDRRRAPARPPRLPMHPGSGPSLV